MEITAHALTVRGPHAPMLRPTSVAFGEYQLALIAGDPGAGHTALSLAVAGRLRPDGGEVRLDGRADERELRRRVAVVDTPGITEPDDALPVRTVVGEELSIAGRKAGRRAVDAWLDEHGATEFADARFEHLPVDVRTRLLAELTAARPDVKAVVLTLPDRFGGDPQDWYGVGRDLAERGYAVLITCTDTSAHVLGVTAARFGEVDQPAPIAVPPKQPPAEEPPAVEEPVEPERDEPAAADGSEGDEADATVDGDADLEGDEK
jgi:ABC-type transport system involved in cytochrome c biogenesis ATPase subunit